MSSLLLATLLPSFPRTPRHASFPSLAVHALPDRGAERVPSPQPGRLMRERWRCCRSLTQTAVVWLRSVVGGRRPCPPTSEESACKSLKGKRVKQSEQTTDIGHIGTMKYRIWILERERRCPSRPMVGAYSMIQPMGRRSTTRFVLLSWNKNSKTAIVLQFRHVPQHTTQAIPHETSTKTRTPSPTRCSATPSLTPPVLTATPPPSLLDQAGAPSSSCPDCCPLPLGSA